MPLQSELYRKVYCNPSRSFDGRGSFHDLADHDTVALHFVDQPQNEESDVVEEQGFEAVLDVDHYGKIVRNTTTETDFDEFSQLLKREELELILKDKSMDGTEKRDAVFKMLERYGIKTFIIVSGPDDDIVEIMQRVRDVIQFVARLRRSHKQTTMKFCLLFQDIDGLLYNLTMPSHVVGTFSQWQGSLHAFSGIQAMGAISILSRSFPCVQAGLIEIGKPALLALVLGLALSEELSLSWLNVSLLIQGVPSTSAYSLVNGGAYADWIYKIIIASLVLAGAAEGTTQRLLTVVGISLACTALLANMGARVWHFLKWRPFAYSGLLGSWFAYIVAIIIGLFFPHMASRNVEAGGKAAVESVLKNIFWVGSLFILSDHDGFQKFLLVGTEACGQSIVNIAIGGWISCTFILNLAMAFKTRKTAHWSDSDNSLLYEAQSSPVGYRVLNFPDFIIDPSQARKGLPFLSMENEVYLAIFVAILIMAAIVSMPYTGWSNALQEYISSLLRTVTS